MTKNKKKTGWTITETALVVVVAALFIVLLVMASEEPDASGEYTHLVPMLMPLFLFLFFVPLPILAFKVAIQENDDGKSAAPDDIAAMIVLISVIMNADGQNTKQELDEVKPFLQEKFGEKKAKKMLLLLKEKLEKDIRNVRPHCARVRRLLPYPQRLEFLTLLFRIAEANGEICQYEAEILRHIAHYTSIDNVDFIGLTHQFSTFYNYQKRQTSVVYHDTGWAYKVLLIEENASQEEIKKAYRKLAMQHHPDKVSRHDTFAQEQAVEKFRRINEAYKLLIK